MLINTKEKKIKLYCSKECRTTAKRNGKIIKCANCEIEVYKTKSDLKGSKSGNSFCSRSCATVINNTLYKSGEDHPNYIDGVGSYRGKALKYYEPKCQVCGYDILVVLEVHHIDEDRYNNELDNLRVVCPTHHKEYHLGIIK